MSAQEKNWQALIEHLKLSRRDFVFSGLAAGALTLTPRFALAQAGAPYKIGWASIRSRWCIATPRPSPMSARARRNR